MGDKWTPARYLKLRYHRCLVPNYKNGELDGYCANILEFTGCMAEGESPGEALRNLERAAEAWIAAQIDSPRGIPRPASYREQMAWNEQREAKPYKYRRRRFK